MIDANISDQLPKLYLFDSLNKTTCGGDMCPYSVIGVAMNLYSGAWQARRRRRRDRDAPKASREERYDDDDDDDERMYFNVA